MENTPTTITPLVMNVVRAFTNDAGFLGMILGFFIGVVSIAGLGCFLAVSYQCYKVVTRAGKFIEWHMNNVSSNLSSISNSVGRLPPTLPPICPACPVSFPYPYGWCRPGPAKRRNSGGEGEGIWVLLLRFVGTLIPSILELFMRPVSEVPTGLPSAVSEALDALEQKRKASQVPKKCQPTFNVPVVKTTNRPKTTRVPMGCTPQPEATAPTCNQQQESAKFQCKSSTYNPEDTPLCEPTDCSQWTMSAIPGECTFGSDAIVDLSKNLGKPANGPAQ